MNSHTIKYKEDEFTICEFGATLLSYKRKGEEFVKNVLLNMQQYLQTNLHDDH
jgi:hypothetical protein